MRVIAMGILSICFPAMLGGQAEKPSGRWSWKQWEKSTGVVTLSMSAASSQRISPSVIRLKDAQIEVGGLILNADEIELNTDTLEADLRAAHLKLEKKK